MADRRRRVDPAIARWTEATTQNTKTDNGTEFPAAAYAYVPDASKPSTWKIRLWETPEKKETAAQVGRAIAAFGKGFMGNKAELPADARSSVRRRIAAAWRKTHPDAKASDMPTELKEAMAGGRTFNEISELIEDAIEEKLGISDDRGVWIRDLTEAWAVYCVGMGDDLFQVDYSIGDQGDVTIGDPKPVEAQTSYVTATESRDRVEGRILEAIGTDEAGGRIFGVQIIAYGDSKNRRRYPESVMRASTRLYEGAKAYDHHRTEQELTTSTIGGLVGSYRNVSAGQAGLEAELHLLPGARHTAEALDASLAAQTAGLPPLVGISHDVMARYRPVDGTAGSRLMEATEIVSVNSADVVADPAAGGRPTRMVAGGINSDEPEEVHQMELKELLRLLREAKTAEARQKLIDEHGQVLTDAGLELDDVVAPLDAGDAGTKGGSAAGSGGEGGDGAGVLVGAGAGSGTAAGNAAAAGATEAIIRRDSISGRQLIHAGLEQAGLDKRVAEAVTRLLPEQFTETQLQAQLDGFTTVRRELEAAGLAPTVPDGKVTADEQDKRIARLDAMFAGDYATGFRSFKQAVESFCPDLRRLDPTAEDLNKAILRECIGFGPDVYDSASRSTESVDTSSFSKILGDSITRRMVAEYQQPNLMTWKQLVSSMPPVNDFRTQRLDRMGGYGTLPGVNQGAPYQALTTPTDEEATYSLTKRGGIEDLTLEAIANDDLRLVQRIPTKLGLAAAQTIYRFVLDMLDTNLTCTYDSTTLFHANHSNTATNALSNSNLSAARLAMRSQAAYGDTSDVLSLVPRTLIVVKNLEPLGYELATSAVALPTAAPDGAASNIPNIHQGLDLLVIDYWSSTTKWIVVADPNMVPTIEVGFYQGRQEPELFVQNDPTVGSVFQADKITWKIRHIYSGTAIDHRGFYRGNT